MKKVLSLLLMFFAVSAVFGAENTNIFAPDFNDPNTFDSQDAYFEKQKNLVFDTVNEQKVLVLERGKIVPRVRFRKPLTVNDDYGCSFTLRRKEATSAFGVSFSGKGSFTGPGSIFINSNGYVYLWSMDKKWHKTDLILKSGVDYKISINVLAAEKKYVVKIDGIGDAEINYDCSSEIIYVMFNPQPPQGNINYISDLKLYR